MDTDFSGMTKSELEALAAEHDVEVTRTDGAEGDPLKDDYVAALTAHFDTAPKAGDVVTFEYDNARHEGTLVGPADGAIVEMHDHARTRVFVPAETVELV